MQIKNWLQYAVRDLSKQTDTAILDAELLLTQVLHVDRTYLLTHGEYELTCEEQKQLAQLLQRRIAGEPIAYIIGHQAFWTLDLIVNPHVLIPRPETELLVEKALAILPQDQPLCIADLATGSGAIALALAKERPNWQITAMDISEQALNIAKENAMRHDIRNVTLMLSDWFEKLTHQQFHAIVSNPPYIAEKDPHLQKGDVRFEPHLALVAGSEGLTAIRHIVQQARKYLLPQGLLLIEHGCEQAQAVARLMQQHQYSNIATYQDLAGHPRATSGIIAA